VTYPFILPRTEEESRTAGTRSAFDFQVILNRVSRKVMVVGDLFGKATRTILPQPSGQAAVTVLVYNVRCLTASPIRHVGILFMQGKLATDGTLPVPMAEVRDFETGKGLKYLQEISRSSEDYFVRLTKASPAAPMRRSCFI
jgi:hypothetical protein